MISNYPAVSAFVSYAHEDTRVAKWLFAELTAIGFRVFLDEQRLSVGDQLDSALERAIRDSQVFVCLISEASLASEWARREFELARSSNRRACAIFLTDRHHLTLWTGLEDIIYVDASASFSQVIPHVTGALPEVFGQSRTLERLAQHATGTQFCVEVLQHLWAALDRHVDTDTYASLFDLGDCFWWNATSAVPGLAIEHFYISPRVVELAAHQGDHSADSKMGTIAASLARTIGRLLDLSVGQINGTADPVAEYSRIVAGGITSDRKLFNLLTLFHDLLVRPVESLSALLDELHARCLYVDTPTTRYRKVFAQLFPTPRGGQSWTVSVVVVSSAVNESIDACLKSLRRQTRPADELILVEDLPCDRSSALASDYRLDHHVCLPPREPRDELARRAACRRVGTAIAQSDIILYLDGDTLITPTLVETLRRRWADWSDGLSACIVFPAVEFHRDEGQAPTYDEIIREVLGRGSAPIPLLSPSVGTGLLGALQSQEVAASTTGGGGSSLSWRQVRSRCWAVRRGDVLEVGNWDTDYVGWGSEDTDLAYRLQSALGTRPRVVAERGVFCIHVAHSVDIASQAEQLAVNEGRLIAKFPELERERMALARRLGIEARLREELNRYS